MAQIAISNVIEIRGVLHATVLLPATLSQNKCHSKDVIDMNLLFIKQGKFRGYSGTPKC